MLQSNHSEITAFKNRHWNIYSSLFLRSVLSSLVSNSHDSNWDKKGTRMTTRSPACTRGSHRDYLNCSQTPQGCQAHEHPFQRKKKSDSHDPLLTPYSDTSHHMPGYDKLANHTLNYRYLINCSPLSAEKWYNFFVPIFWTISLSITQHWHQSVLGRIMACRPTASSHESNHCWQQLNSHAN